MVLKSVKGKVQVTHRNTTHEVQRGSIGTAPHIPEFGTKGGWVVNSTPGSLYPQERAMVYLAWEADRDSGLIWMSGRREVLLPSPWFKLRKTNCTIQFINLIFMDPCIVV
jgi:hypothetical protein